MSLLKDKPGRRAGPVDRQIAADWLGLYRKAQAQPGGRLCLNPDDDPAEQTWLNGNDPEQLLLMLEQFSEHGTFAFVSDHDVSIQEMLIRMSFKEMRGNGTTSGEAIEKLASEYSASVKTIERVVYLKS